MSVKGTWGAWNDVIVVRPNFKLLVTSSDYLSHLRTTRSFKQLVASDYLSHLRTTRSFKLLFASSEYFRIIWGLPASNYSSLLRTTCRIICGLLVASNYSSLQTTRYFKLLLLQTTRPPSKYSSLQSILRFFRLFLTTGLLFRTTQLLRLFEQVIACSVLVASLD